MIFSGTGASNCDAGTIGDVGGESLLQNDPKRSEELERRDDGVLGVRDESESVGVLMVEDFAEWATKRPLARG